MRRKNRVAKTRAEKIRAIMKEAEDEQLLRADNELKSLPAPTQLADKPAQQPLAEAQPAAPTDVEAAKQPEPEPEAVVVQKITVQPAAAEPKPVPSDTIPAKPPAEKKAIETRREEKAQGKPKVSQAGFYGMLGLMRKSTRASHLSGAEVYLRRASAPDPYLERLVQTVLALPRPQLHPPSEQDAAEKADGEPAAAEGEAESTASKQEKGVQASPADEVAARPQQPAVVAASQQARAVPRAAVKSPGKAVRRSGGAVPRTVRSTAGPRHPKAASPRRWADQACRLQQPQQADAVLLVANAGHEATACAGMTGTVEGMPVGADAVAPQPKQALERSCCTPPRRKSLLHRVPEEASSTDNGDDVPEMGLLVDEEPLVELEVSSSSSSSSDDSLHFPIRGAARKEVAADLTSSTEESLLLPTDGARLGARAPQPAAAAATESEDGAAEEQLGWAAIEVSPVASPDLTAGETRWGELPIGDLSGSDASPQQPSDPGSEETRAADTSSVVSDKSRSPASVSGQSEPVSVPGEPGESHHVESLTQLAVDVGGSWRAVLKDDDTCPKQPAGEGADMGGKREVAFVLHQLGVDFVTGHHAQSDEAGEVVVASAEGSKPDPRAFYIRDGRVSYEKAQPEPGAAAARLAFTQVFSDSTECTWSGVIEWEKGLPKPSQPSQAVRVVDGVWVEGDRRGTFEAWRPEQKQQPEPQPGPEQEEEGQVAESSGSDLLEQSSLSSALGTDESRALSEDASASVSMSDVRPHTLALVSLLPGSECCADGGCVLLRCWKSSRV